MIFMSNKKVKFILQNITQPVLVLELNLYHRYPPEVPAEVPVVV